MRTESFSILGWYWHRWRAMGRGEALRHLRKRWRQWEDRRVDPTRLGAGVDWTESRDFPPLPQPEAAPAELRSALERQVAAILKGEWRPFGGRTVRIDSPPAWQRDYRAGVDLATDRWAFDLDHRRLPEGADIRVIWELNRWHLLVRLAQGAYLLNREDAAAACVGWLGDWVAKNPPFRGWNWTSPLESGIRLIQFAWIDALIASSNPGKRQWAEWRRLREAILPANAYYTWRYRSYGSSANNHLMGELAGLIVAGVRWAGFSKWGPFPGLDRLQGLWESEVLAQFAEDGGNREQALNYHLFSWELCWQVRAALGAIGRPVSPEVLERLQAAADFWTQVQVADDPWDYGDSDDAVVTPLFEDDRQAISEWWHWLSEPSRSPALDFWWCGPHPGKSGRSRAARSTQGGEGAGAAPGRWLHYPETGLAVWRGLDWVLRWDLSPLGYLSTAAHGHLDALHLSIWYQGKAFVIDPGTGAYYLDPKLRSYLASWAAHNGPHLPALEFPKRRGPFLWDRPHAVPRLRRLTDADSTGRLDLPCGYVERSVAWEPEGDAWTVGDRYVPAVSDRERFEVRWQFAPNTRVESIDERTFQVKRHGSELRVRVDSSWREIYLHSEESSEDPLIGICAPGFRETCRAPVLRLVGVGNSCVFSTSFLASSSS